VKPLRKKRLLVKVGAALVLAAAIITGAAFAGDPNSKEASAEMKWGFKVARRGYWQEALMRFEHANALTPNQPRILNNIAVAQEANGLYEMALLTYQEGLALDPGNTALRRNYTRFQEFYSSYISPPEPGEEKEEQDAPQDN
jgi:tetratricopeptide (TPR) repeat protein